MGRHNVWKQLVPTAKTLVGVSREALCIWYSRHCLKVAVMQSSFVALSVCWPGLLVSRVRYQGSRLKSDVSVPSLIGRLFQRTRTITSALALPLALSLVLCVAGGKGQSCWVRREGRPARGRCLHNRSLGMTKWQHRLKTASHSQELIVSFLASIVFSN